MAEISLLEPRVLNGVIQDFTAPESLVGKMLVGEPMRDINPIWEYDIKRTNREVGNTYNVPNGEARNVDQDVFAKMNGSYAYVRDKKMLNATSQRWLRMAGENTVASGNAEKLIMSELESLRMQHMRGEELAIWAMFGGHYGSSFNDVGIWKYEMANGVPQEVNYRIPSANKVQITGNVDKWNVATGKAISHTQTLKRVVQRSSGFPIVKAYMNSKTMSDFVRIGEVSGNTTAGTADVVYAGLSDRQIDMLKAEGKIPRFYGIDWMEYDGGYKDSDGTFVPYIQDNNVVFLTDNMDMAFGFLYGPSADKRAPAGHTGPFSKIWDEEDPSGTQLLMECNYMPVLWKPDQVAVLKTV